MLLFSLQVIEAFSEHSKTFMVGLFLWKKLLTIFQKNLHHRLLVGFYIQLLAKLSKNNSHLNDISQIYNFLCLYSYHTYFFCCTNQKKCVTKRNKILNFWSLFINWEPSSSFPLIESLKITCARSHALFLNFLWYRECLDCFSWLYVLPKLSKITVACPNSLRWTSRANLDLPKVCKMTITFELL